MSSSSFPSPPAPATESASGLGPATSRKPAARSINLVGASAVGIGAIVGGGILVLAGVAFQTTGPSALLAFALNGFVAVLTALSFAELSTQFPENGGAYIFARKVLGVRPAFGVGWIIWFAYIVAGVLYALGFAEYALSSIRALWPGEAPPFLSGRAANVALALGSAGFYTISLIRKASGGGEWATWGKVAVFVLLIAIGIGSLFFREDAPIKNGMSPFFPHGSLGLLQAMGFTFIALQGFEIIGAVGGEVKDPAKTIPKAMLISLGCALAIYLPLLFIVSTAGVPEGDSIGAMAERDSATVMATAVGNYLGPAGFWFVMLAGVLSTLSALQANILAASRVALTMARDRTLPPVLGQLHPERKTPLIALYATALALVAILFMLPDLAAAGAAASLIFLISFAIGHGIAWLSRRRSTERILPFKAPFYPWLPLFGGGICLALAIFQAVNVPAAGGITGIWLGLGVLLYFGIFQARASTVDASALARDPELLRLRGKSPVVLVPIANPASVPSLVNIAGSLAPPSVGRVLFMNVAGRQAEIHGDAIDNAQRAMGAALRAAAREGHQAQALTTVADDAWEEINRVASSYRCHGVLLGGARMDPQSVARFEAFVNSIDSDVSILFAAEDWSLKGVERVVVPVGGRGSHHTTRARLLGGLRRSLPLVKVHWVRVVPDSASKQLMKNATRQLEALAADTSPRHSSIEVIASDESLDTLTGLLNERDLLVLGLADDGGRRTFGAFLPELIKRSPCAVLVVARGDEGEHWNALLRGLKNLGGRASVADPSTEPRT